VFVGRAAANVFPIAGSACVCVFVCVCVCISVCVTERERERKGEREKVRDCVCKRETANVCVDM